MYMYDNDAYLCHYGILGMKWGIRRTPEQLGRHTIKKGTKIYRQTLDPNEDLSGSKYVSYLRPDRDMYKGPFAASLRSYKHKDSLAPLYEKSYSAVEDIMVPSRKEYIKALDSAIQKNKKAVLDEYIRNELRDKVTDDEDDIDYMIKSKSPMYRSERDLANHKAQEQDFWTSDDVRAITKSIIGGNPKIKNDMIDIFKKQGYNAMVDEYGVGGSGYVRKGVDPLIIFNAEQTLQELKTRKVSKTEEIFADTKATDWLDTANFFAKFNTAW